VVTPHRAQQGLIIAKLQALFPTVDPGLIREAVDTVERFQGGQRDVILASMAVGDADTIAQEEEFLGNLNRFNVLVSRARSKVVVLCTQELLDHLPAELAVLQGSRLLKAYCGCFGGNELALSLPSAAPGGGSSMVAGTLRW
jgi:superfamily I DNA and/or RNA helicase